MKKEKKEQNKVFSKNGNFNLTEDLENIENFSNNKQLRFHSNFNDTNGNKSNKKDWRHENYPINKLKSTTDIVEDIKTDTEAIETYNENIRNDSMSSNEEVILNERLNKSINKKAKKINYEILTKTPREVNDSSQAEESFMKNSKVIIASKDFKGSNNDKDKYKTKSFNDCNNNEYINVEEDHEKNINKEKISIFSNYNKNSPDPNHPFKSSFSSQQTYHSNEDNVFKTDKDHKPYANEEVRRADACVQLMAIYNFLNKIWPNFLINFFFYFFL